MSNSKHSSGLVDPTGRPLEAESTEPELADAQPMDPGRPVTVCVFGVPYHSPTDNPTVFAANFCLSVQQMRAPHPTIPGQTIVVGEQTVLSIRPDVGMALLETAQALAVRDQRIAQLEAALQETRVQLAELRGVDPPEPLPPYDLPPMFIYPDEGEPDEAEENG